MRLATLATCALNQWALDFDGNLARVRASIAEARARGARYRLGPDLELTGYGCEDHFLEPDTERHAWESVAELLREGDADGLLCDVGLPVTHHGVRYAARVLLLDRRVLLVRPATALADHGAYRESRWFAPWRPLGTVEPFPLPAVVRDATGQEASVIGDAVIETLDARLDSEPGAAPFGPRAPRAAHRPGDVDIVAHACASHHELREPAARLRRLRADGAGTGGVRLYADQQGCDGGRAYYAGGAAVVVGGEAVAYTAPFSLRDVEVVSADVDLAGVRSRRVARSGPSRPAGSRPSRPVVRADIELTRERPDRPPSPPVEPRPHAVEEEIAWGPAAWLWDVLRRSGAGGFLLPLSGGADSAAVAMLVTSMCRRVAERVAAGDDVVAADATRVLGLPEGTRPPDDPRRLVGRLLTTAYLATRVSGDASRARARALAEAIGADHLEAELQDAVDALAAASTTATSTTAASSAEAPDGDGGRRTASPRFASEGGSDAEDLALQNLQARTRLVAAYLLAQRSPALRGVRGPRLLLGTSNADEALVGYVTKYDTSSADVNPIGGIGKTELRRFLAWARDAFGVTVLDDVLAAAPSAELRPAGDGPPQRDEDDLGLSYDELATLGRLRGVERCGPLATFERLLTAWAPATPREVADKVRRFYRRYGANRHKATVATPAYAAGGHAPDDHRSDPRPFLLSAGWERQFRAIDREVHRLEGRGS